MLLAVVGAVAVPAAAPSAAWGFDPLGPLCSGPGAAGGATGAVCSVAQPGGGIMSVALNGIEAWVVGGARSLLDGTASVMGRTTSPQLTSTWFSSTYWRVAGVSVLLTLPFLFAAAVQALLASDVTLLVRSALGYLPLAMLGVGIAAPLTMLLLSASDELSSIVSAAGGDAGVHFLARVAGGMSGLAGFDGSPFLVFFVALFTVGAALILWLELLVRASAVYVIVLLLPLAFAALVWPARRVWAARALELLVALILSKFVIVAVLSLGAAALGSAFASGLTSLMGGLALLGLAIFAPWAMLRLLPMAEVAGGAAAALRPAPASAARHASRLAMRAESGEAWALARTSEMRRSEDGLAALPAQDAGPEPSPATPVAMEAAATGSSPPAGAAGGAPSPDRRSLRLPNFPADSMWQAEDETWRPIVLGPDGEWPPRLWPIEDAPEQDGVADANLDSGSAEPSEDPSEPPEEAG